MTREARAIRVAMACAAIFSVVKLSVGAATGTMALLASGVD